MRFSVSFVAVVCFVLTAAARGQEISQDSLAKAKAELHSQIESGAIAGGAHMVVRDGETVYFEVAGACDIEDKTPLKPDTIMRIYSMTKPITSVAAMTLYEQGKFKLDDPISKYIPAFEKTRVVVTDGDAHKLVPADRQITVRDLFRHTTGYSYGGQEEVREHYEREHMRYRPPHGMLPPKMKIDAAADALARIPALHHPGKRFTYGLNTDILGRLIEVWSGKPLDEYLRSAVFEPLEMVDTGFSIPKKKRGRFASCHAWENDKHVVVDKASTSPFNDGFEFLSGGGGLVSTMQDYANFCQMMIDGGQFKGRRVLKASTIKLMFTDQLGDVPGDFKFGLGFAIADVTLGSGAKKRTATSYYWGGYANTAFRIVPEEKFFQIFMRQTVPSTGRVANKVFAIVYEGVE